MRIAFCCTGNTCRSPMAEFIMLDELNRIGAKGVEVCSFGLFAAGNQPISEYAAYALDKLGVPYKDRVSIQVTKEIYDECDYVFAMTDGHKKALINTFGSDSKVFTLSEASEAIGDISDPYGGNRSDYLKCAEEIRQKTKIIAEKIKSMTTD